MPMRAETFFDCSSSNALEFLMVSNVVGAQLRLPVVVERLVDQSRWQPTCRQQFGPKQLCECKDFGSAQRLGGFKVPLKLLDAHRHAGIFALLCQPSEQFSPLVLLPAQPFHVRA